MRGSGLNHRPMITMRPRPHIRLDVERVRITGSGCPETLRLRGASRPLKQLMTHRRGRDGAPDLVHGTLRMKIRRSNVETRKTKHNPNTTTRKPPSGEPDGGFQCQCSRVWNRRCVLPPWRRWAVQLVTFSSEGSGGGLPLRCGANPSSCLPSELSRPRYACSAPPVTRCSASHVVDVFCRVSRPWVAALLVAQLRPRPWSLDLALVVFPSDASQLV